MAWETITFICCILAGIFRFLTLCNRLVKAMQLRVNTEAGIIVQDQVFKTAERAVMIVEQEFKKSKYEGEEKSRLKHHQAQTIIVDVLLQNGLNPSSYNLQGLISYALCKLGL